MYREIHCDEYLRLRLRKSKAIQFKHRGKRRYERRRAAAAMAVSIFSGAFSLPPGLLFPSKNLLIIRGASHVFVLHTGRDTLSRAGKTEDGNLLFPRSYDDVIYASGEFDSRDFQSRRARGLYHAASRRALLFSCNVARGEFMRDKR